ncbi:MAG: hypothetical protein M3P84_03670 [Chloroflexota bacterium]|nr:hypothetical protein [Chloroflexota bacterium]
MSNTNQFETYRRDRVSTWIEAIGSNMEPLIGAGDRLLVAFGARPERTGQVILYAVDGRLVARRMVAHRIVTDPAGVPLVRLIAKGDAELLPDRAIAPESVLGVVQAIHRGEDDRLIRYGLDDTPSAVVAAVSWWGAQAARRSRRVARHAPPAVGPALLFGLLTLSQVPTRVITGVMPRLAQERPGS